ncbi:MAG: hypothetical protein AAGA83_08225, partial [Cyanobacteria bacterium P01_F01_bin.116]
WLRGLTRQTQEIDFSELIQRPRSLSGKLQDSVADDDSVAGEVDKSAVLALIDELTLDEAKEKALAVSHSEDVSAWVAKILVNCSTAPQRLIELQQQLRMSLVEVWIASLLGGFQLEQRGEFYETEEIWLSVLENK